MSNIIDSTKMIAATRSTEVIADTGGQMRPWHRDVIAITGMLLIACASFLVSTVLGLYVLGTLLVIAAVLLSLTRPDSEGPDNGA